MGQMRFTVPQCDMLPPDALERVYLAGLDGVPWRSRVTELPADGRGGRQFVMERPIRESGNLYLPWRCASHGVLTLSTASLMERDEPYLLPLELARGTLNRLRNQVADWEAARITVPAAAQDHIRSAIRALIRSATAQGNDQVCTQAAQDCLDHALHAIEAGCLSYAEQLVERRRQQPQASAAWVAGGVAAGQASREGESAFKAAFNGAVVSPRWRDLESTSGSWKWEPLDRQFEWCRTQGLAVCAGPLLRLEAAQLPDWIYLWHDDFEQLQSYILGFAEACLRRYRGQANLWHLAASLNVRDALHLSEEAKLRLIVNVIDMARSLDPRTPIMVSFDQPWAEFLAHDDSGLSPLHFADSLARADLGIAALGLEINYGYWPGGTMPRDLLEFNRQIDRWGSLGLPLVVSLIAPSDRGRDPGSTHPGQPLPDLYPGGVNPVEQARVVDQVLALLLAKNSVRGVLWPEGNDATPHEFSHSGLLDAEGRPKPLLPGIARLRARFL